MDGKFTIRDILVYFMSGFLFTLTFTITYSDFIYSQLESHKDYLTIYGLISLPTCYIIGHIVHSIDVSIFSAIGNSLKKLHDKKKSKISLFLHNLFNGHRIRGILDEYWHQDKEFTEVVCYCSNHLQYNEARYWSYLNDTFKGYMLTFLIFSISALIRLDEPTLGIILVILTILFRQRGRFFGIYYVQSISRIYNSMKNNK